MDSKLTVSQQSRLRSLLRDQVHPDRIDAFLLGCGIQESEIASVYSELNLRRSHLLSSYMMKRNVRIIGFLLVLGSIGVVAVGGQLSFVFSIGLFVYGLALMMTGNFTVYHP